MNPGPPRFTVGLVEKAREQFAQRGEKAKQLGLQKILGAAFRRIIDALETEPREWGDPDTSHRGLNATGYHKAIISAGPSIRNWASIWKTRIRPCSI